jgi:hypothetical protein
MIKLKNYCQRRESSLLEIYHTTKIRIRNKSLSACLPASSKKRISWINRIWLSLSIYTKNQIPFKRLDSHKLIEGNQKTRTCNSNLTYSSLLRLKLKDYWILRTRLKTTTKRKMTKCLVLMMCMIQIKRMNYLTMTIKSTLPSLEISCLLRSK